MELTIHVDPVERTVRFREVHALAAGDSCSVVLEGVRGADVAALRLALYRDAASDSPVASCPSFAPVRGHPNLATGDLRLDTTEMAAWFEAVRPEPEGPATDRDGSGSGGAAERAVRTDGWLVVSEPTRTWAACRVPVILRPGAGVSGVVDPTSIQSLVEGLVSAAMSEALASKADKTNVYTKAEVDEKVDAVDNKADDAHSAAEQMVNAVYNLKNTIGTHIRDTKNPHKVTAAQVGALPLTGGTISGDLAVGEDHSGARKIFVASDELADGITLQGGSASHGSSVTVGGSSGRGGTLTVRGGRDYEGSIEVTGSGASIKKDGKEVATEEQVAEKADKSTTLAGYGITDAATKASLAPEYSPSSAYSVGAFVYHDGSIYQCTTAISDGGEAWNAAHWELRKLDDFFTESNSLLNGRIAYSRNETGLKDRAFNALTFDGTEYNLSTALAAVTPTASGQPRDLLIVATATAATTISFTAGTIKGDKPTIDGSGTWLITLTEYASGVWYCRQIKMEDAA